MLFFPHSRGSILCRSFCIVAAVMLAGPSQAAPIIDQDSLYPSSQFANPGTRSNHIAQTFTSGATT